MRDEYEFGPQPLEDVLQRFGLASADLVNASKEQLSFKMVQKGRKGRRLTPPIQRKVAKALTALCAARGIERSFKATDLFTYCRPQ